MKLKRTCRGFKYAEFEDANGEAASIQESSAVPMLWLGLEKGTHHMGECMARMHLTRKQVKALLPHLQKFAKTGHL